MGVKNNMNQFRTTSQVGPGQLSSNIGKNYGERQKALVTGNTAQNAPASSSFTQKVKNFLGLESSLPSANAQFVQGNNDTNLLNDLGKGRRSVTSLSDNDLVDYLSSITGKKA